jgi:hypothetical protein
MSLYATFKTDEKLEEEGVTVQYGELFKVRVARLGNPKFMALHEKLMKPWRKVREDMRDKKAIEEINAKCFAEAIVVPGSWQTKVREGLEVDPTCGDPDAEGWVRGIEMRVGDKDVVKPATAANIAALFKALPGVFVALFRESNDIENYRVEQLQADSKNS